MKNKIHPFFCRIQQWRVVNPEIKESNNGITREALEERHEYLAEKAREAFEDHDHDHFEGFDQEDDDMCGMIPIRTSNRFAYIF